MLFIQLNAEELSMILQDRDVDILLIDHRMPEMNGVT
jgi:CheY-like chemotaxis protein